ncbi:hypothetical protein [Domibacillus robiginosus]|uniref:hypothetical protein n=1 Tax=Domibacillus robiginosus TaxID=1071054 RepID=UPI00067B89B0|nr:hypothetical protein [Domibacillus robiginosus]
MSLTVLFVLVLLGGSLLEEPIHREGLPANNVILLLCTLAFILIALWSKTWFSVVIPLVLFGPTFFFERSNVSGEAVLYDSAAITIIACLLIAIWPLFIKQKDQPKK